MQADAYTHAVAAAAAAADSVSVDTAASDATAPAARTTSGPADAVHLASACDRVSSAHLEGRVAALKECRWRTGGCFRHLSVCCWSAVLGFGGVAGSERDQSWGSRRHWGCRRRRYCCSSMSCGDWVGVTMRRRRRRRMRMLILRETMLLGC